MPTTTDATTNPLGVAEVFDLPDGRYYRWRGAVAVFGTTDLLKFPCRSKAATLTLLELADGDAPTTTTFTPQLGVKDNFTLGTIDGRVASASADAPSRSQSPVALDLCNGALFVRPAGSGSAKLQYVCVIREGHRV